MREPLRHSIILLRNPRLVLLHLVINAAVLVAASFWMLIPDAHVWELLLAGLSALAILFFFLWLHSGTLAYAADPVPEKFRDAFSPRASRILWLLVGLAVLFALMYVVSGWTDSSVQVSGYAYSKAPTWLRPVSGSSGYATILQYILAILFWYVLPAVLLPIIACPIAGTSFLRGFRTLGRWQYWLTMAVLALVGIGLTSLILGWTPGKTLNEQTVSLIIRLALVYVIATAAWLATAGLLGYFVAASASGSHSDVVRETAS